MFICEGEGESGLAHLGFHQVNLAILSLTKLSQIDEVLSWVFPFLHTVKCTIIRGLQNANCIRACLMPSYQCIENL